MYPILLPLSVPDMSKIFLLVKCQLNPIIPSYPQHLKDFLDSSKKFLESLLVCDPKNLGGFILTKSRTFDVVDPPLAFKGP